MNPNHDDNALAAALPNDPLSHLLSLLRRQHSERPGQPLRRIDVDRAAYLLDAAAGDVNLASGLFWDNEGPVLKKRKNRRVDFDPSTSISDDDAHGFVPGPDPVFRQVERTEVVGEEQGQVGADRGVDAAAGEAEFFDVADDSIRPSDVLWAAFVSNDQGGTKTSSSIPSCWLRTGFGLSECANGLSLAPPSEEEQDNIRRLYPFLGRRGLKSLPGFPYHCKGTSALLSIVTAVLYSGASIRGSTVSCNADRTPFVDLTPERRQREFPERLTEALSALIFIAAQSASGRLIAIVAAMEERNKRNKKLTPVEEDEYVVKRLAMMRRVGQCRVCRWETEDVTNTPLNPSRMDPENVRVHSSLTNIRDIRSYVRSHLRSFIEPGGCALFLETIARCHGSSYFKRRFEYVMGEGDTTKVKVASIRCRCKETLQYLEERSMEKKSSEIPPEADCFGVGLLSLLLTGQAHATYQNWSADKLGIGFLRVDRMSVIGSRLLRPIKPIWICLGDFGYSTLVLDREGFSGRHYSLDEPGRTFKLAHWNCWSGERTGMRVIPSILDSSMTEDLGPCVSGDGEQDCNRTVKESMVIRSEEEQKRDSGDLCGPDVFGVPRNHDLGPITEEELRSVMFHPEDEKYYPGDYRRWRCKVQSRNSEWISFYRLHGRERLVVEMKAAPRICALVRSRWPLATVCDFVPSDKFPLV